MRVIVCGTREWPQEHLGALREVIADRLFDLPTDSVIVHGNARGADRIAHQEAQKLGLYVEDHPYQDFITETCSPKRAPLERNTHIASLGADLCISFWDGKSTGTADMTSKAEVRGIPVETIYLCRLRH